MYYLASVELFERGIQASESISQQWNQTWSLSLGGAKSGSFSGTLLYGVLADLGVVLAVCTLLFFAFKTIKELNEGKSEGFTSLIWPFIVAYLLSQGGAPLRSLTLSLRNTLNTTNQQILGITLAGVRLDEAYREAQNLGNAQTNIANYLRQCETLQGEKQLQCLEVALEQSETLLEDMQQAFGPLAWLQERLDGLAEIGEAIADNPASLLIPGQNPIFWAIIGPVWEAAAYSLLWAWQLAFQNAVEASMLLTAIVAPLAVGGSLLPLGGARPIFAWLTGFLSIGMLKLSFNILAGLAAVNFVNSQNTDPLYFPFLLAVFAPVLASAIAFGGGLAVWSAITGIARSLVTAGMQFL